MNKNKESKNINNQNSTNSDICVLNDQKDRPNVSGSINTTSSNNNSNSNSDKNSNRNGNRARSRYIDNKIRTSQNNNQKNENKKMDNNKSYNKGIRNDNPTHSNSNKDQRARSYPNPASNTNDNSKSNISNIIHDNFKLNNSQNFMDKKQSEVKNENKGNQDSHSGKQDKLSNHEHSEKSQIKKLKDEVLKCNDPNYGRGSSITVLHIAEKPSIALSIAKALCGKLTMQKEERKMCPVFKFKSLPFPKATKAQSCTHKVTSVVGHVFSLDFHQRYQNWDAVDPLELFNAETVKKPTKTAVIHHLQSEAKAVDFICLWMDCDREGENINFEVLGLILEKTKAAGPNDYRNVFRAHFSAINEVDILKAYNNLGKPDICASLAVDARQELDLKVGVAFSRFQTRYFQGRYGNLDSSILSYGPCQTPTLGFCVQRHIDIETFKSQPYWMLNLVLNKGSMKYFASWSGGRSFNKNKLEEFVNSCSEKQHFLKVVDVVSTQKKQGRPTPMNTVGFLKACSKSLSIGPHAAMLIAERLYLSGYLSYPRTESTSYPKSFDIQGTLENQRSDPRWGAYVSTLLRDGFTKAKTGVDMGDHPPIVPCRSAGPHELDGDANRVYDLVVRHFIATVSPDAIWDSTAIHFELNPPKDLGKFVLRGKQMVSLGFLSILMHKYSFEKDEGDEGEDEEEQVHNLPKFNKNDMFPLYAVSTNSSKVIQVIPDEIHGRLCIEERMTTPPKYLTESDLITMMEKNGIGTDASIPTHIENIIKRNYVDLVPGRRLQPTKLGIVLVQGYHRIDSSLVLPKVRADIEQQCDRIAKGNAAKNDVTSRALSFFQQKFSYFVENVERMDVLFSSCFAKLEDSGKPFTRCGFSRRYLQYIEGPPPRLYNRYTEDVYQLPIGGIHKQWGGMICNVPECNFELLLYTVGNPLRTFPLCPNCFLNPRPEWAQSPLYSLYENEEDESAEDSYEEDKQQDDIIPSKSEARVEKLVVKEDSSCKKPSVGGRALTLDCPLQDGHPSIVDQTVCADEESGGVFIIDPTGGPKWRLVSTRAPTTLQLPPNVHKVTVLNRKDEATGSAYVRIDFKKDNTPLENGETTYTGCFVKDEFLQSLVNIKYGQERLKRVRRGHGRGGRVRGGGRGRGRGGRGRRGQNDRELKMSFHGF